jgi:hypothetical protein
MFQSKALLFKASSQYPLSLTEFAKHLDGLRALYIDQYGDLTESNEVTEFFEEGSKAFNIYNFLANQEANPKYTGNRRETYKSIDLVDVLDGLIKRLNDIIQAKNDYYPFKKEMWYTTGIKGVANDKPGAFLFTEILMKVQELRNTFGPLASASPADDSETMASMSPGSRLTTAGFTPAPPDNKLGRTPSPIDSGL